MQEWRKTVLLQGLSLTVALAGVLLGISLAADHLLSLGMVARLVLLAVLASVTCYTAFRFLIRQLRKMPTDAQVARYVEERHPELNDGLVSAVEFGEKTLSVQQQRMFDRLLEQVDRQTGHIDFKHLVAADRMRRAVGLAGVAIVFLSVLAVRDADLFGRSLVRLAAPWSRPGPLLPTGLSVEPGDARLPRGHNQMVVVTLEGRLVAQVRLFTRAKDAKTWDAVEMVETATTGVFNFELGVVDQDIEYYVDADRSTSPVFTLTVYDPPQIERIDLVYDFPVYAGLERKTEEDKGDITAPVGTVVKLTITVNKPVKSGHLKFSNGVETALDTDNRTLTGSLTVKEDLSYSIQVIDMDGMSNLDPVEYYIRAQQDQGPHVTILEPGRDTRVSPVEEVLIRAEAEDDFGLSSFTLTYSVNGGKEQTIDLGRDTGSGTTWKGEHMLYLEEMSVKPGDFLSYYATAADARGKGGKASTDIYFLEVKPFEETYRQGAGGGGGGGGGAGGLQAGRLSQEQKEIIAATWRVKRDAETETSDRIKTDLEAIAKAQDRVQERAQESLNEMRFQFEIDENLLKMTDLLEEALEPMGRVSEALRSGSADAALPPEQEALRYLMQVDALIREFEVSMARDGRAGGAPLDFGDTSELELKRDENRYESPDQANQSQRQSQTVDESLQRVKELAQRQQQLNNQMRQFGDNARQTEAERRRELDRLTREQAQLRQQAEQLAAGLSRMPSGQSDRQMNESLRDATGGLRESSEEMARSSQALQRNNPQEASGQGSKALQRLEDARQQLQRAQGQSLERLTQEAARRADQLAARQDQAARAVEELKKEKDRDFSGIRSRLDALEKGRTGLSEESQDKRLEAFVRKRLREVADGKEQMRQELERLKNDLDYLKNRAQKDQPGTADAAEQALDTIDDGLPQKVDRSKGQLQPGGLDRAARNEKELLQDFKQLAEQVRQTQKNLIAPDEDQLTRTQDDLRDAMSDWQDIQRQLDRLERGLSPGTSGQTSQDYREQMQQLRDLADRLPQNSQAGRQMRDALNRAAALGNEPWKIDRQNWQELHQKVSQALQDVQRDMAGQLRELAQKEKLRMARDEDVPPQFRDLVNRYYEKLSKETR